MTFKKSVFHVFYVALFLVLGGISPVHAERQDDGQPSYDDNGDRTVHNSPSGRPMYPGVQYSGPGNPAGDITVCPSVRDNSGRSISGGAAGLSTSSDLPCFSGGGQSFCASISSYDYSCAGVSINGVGEDIKWPEFDPEEGKPFSHLEEGEFYSITTRDDKRGRAGYTTPLYMNQYDICRQVDNTGKTLPPVFMGVSTEDEWRTVHGVPAGGDKNGGYTRYANDPTIGVPPLKVCCSPVEVEVCGVLVNTGYGVVGDVASLWVDEGEIFAFAQVQCVANNDWRTLAVEGVCTRGGGGGGGGGDPGGDSGRGYSNDQGGTISASDFDSMSPDAQATATSEMGYSATPQDVDTNAIGAADVEAAEAAAAEAQQAANQAAIDAAQAAAEAAQAAADAENDSDGDD